MRISRNARRGSLCLPVSPFAILSGKFGAKLAQGQSGGVVAMPDPNGRTVLRTYVSPNQPGTVYQTTAQAVFTSVSEARQSLSQPQVDAWQAIATTITLSGRLGLDYTLNWSSLFTRVNSYRVMQGSAMVLDPPTLDTAPAFTFISITSDDGAPTPTLIITTHNSAGYISPQGYMSFRISRDQGSAARQARKTDLRYVDTTENSILVRALTFGNTTYNLTDTRFNTFAGQFIGVEVLALSENFYPSARLFITNVVVGVSP